jgi:hypothetical protein
MATDVYPTYPFPASHHYQSPRILNRTMYFDPHNPKIPRRLSPRAHNPSVHAIRNVHSHLFSLWNGQKTASQLGNSAKQDE